MARSKTDLDLDDDEDDLSLVTFDGEPEPITTYAQLKKALRDPLYLNKTPVGHHYRKSLLNRMQ